MKSARLIAIVVSVLAILWIVSGVIGKAPEQQQAPDAVATEDQKSPEATPVSVRVRELEAAPYADQVVVTGRSQAARSVVLRAESDGAVESIAHEEGARITEGETLAVLETRDREARVREARERVNQRQIEYNAAKALEHKGFNSKVRLAQALADLEDAKAALKQAEVDRGKTRIQAPFEGIILQQDIEIGDYLSPGGAVFTVVDLDPIEIVGFVSERRIQDIRPGGKASAQFLDGSIIEGVISYIAPAADPQTRTFRVIMRADNPDFVIREGLTARLKIPVAEKQAFRISPSILALNDAGQIGVKIVNAQDIVEFVPVQIISDQPSEMWVAGPAPGSRFITVGQDFVRAGQAVRPVLADGDGPL